jgi:Tol biopolymer transport system component/beta-lactamase regulating signal transducer with metallopeptidase domain
MEGMMTFVQPFFDWLGQTTLIGSVVICLILVIQKTLGGRLGPRWCHALWLVLLIRMILPWAPSSRLSLFNLIPSWDRQNQPQRLSEMSRKQETFQTSQIHDSTEATAAEKPESVAEIQGQADSKPGTLVYMQKESQQKLTSLRRAFPILWLAGAIVIGAYIFVSNFALWRIVKRESPLVNQEMLELFEECKAQMDVQSLVVVIPSEQVRSPGLFGFIRPRLLLPREMLDNASREEMRYVFLHELAHLRRSDIYLGWLTSLLQILHWFNPLVWFAFYRMRTDRELACDALVLTQTGQEKSHEYGGAIVGLLRRFSRSRRLPAMAGIIENRSQLKRRITMITQFKKNSYRWSPLAIILIVILACVSLPDAISTRASGASDTVPAPPISLRRVWSGPDVDAYGKVSSDGQYLSYTDWETGDLAIHQLATGKTQRLTETKKGGQQKFFRFALNSVISPDGKLIAYSWTNQHGTYDLCVIGIDGSGDRTLYSSKDNELYPSCWSSDGKQIAARKFTSKGGYLEIISVSVADGTVKVLTTSEKPFWPQFCYSPNNKFFVYDFPVEGNSKNYDINLIFTDVMSEIPLIKHPASDRLLGWVPNHKDVLFLSNRAGTYDIWAIKVVGNTPQDSPRPIARDVGQVSPQGFTQDGSFYFSRYTRKFTTYLVPFARDTGEIKDKLKIPLLGSNFDPEWSPNGQNLAYIEEQTEPEGPGYYHRPLHIRNVKTGKERILASDFAVRSPCWSPDGRTILVTGRDRRRHDQLDYNGGIYKISIQDGKVTELVQFPPVEVWSRDIWVKSVSEWAPDGKTFFYTNRGKIIRREFENGLETQLYEENLFARSLDLSPDGKKLAFFEGKFDEGPSRIMITPISGGDPSELCNFQEIKGGIRVPDTITWTPDGNYVLFAKDDEKGASVCRVSSEGGEPEVIWKSKDRITDLSVHPDGEKIAISTYLQEHSIWAMENFLPGTPVAKSEPAPEPALRRVEVRGRGSVHSRPSFDGKYMLDVNKKTGNLVARELATGKEQVLTKNSDPNWFVHGSLISCDSKNVAFYHYNPDKEDFDLRIVGLDGSGLRTLLGAEIAGRFNMDAWSPDGKYIFGKLMKKPVRLVRLSIDDGSIQVLKTFNQGRVSKIDVSPDGRYITYSYAEQEGANPNIFVFDLEQNIEAPLVTHPAGDKLLGWTPDGQHVFFTSDRNRTWDGWLLRVVDGKPGGLPEVIKPGLGDVSPLGFTHSGSFYYAFQHEAWNVYTAALDSKTGEVISDPEPMRHVGRDIRPDWSPDGRYIAYLSEIDRNKKQIIRIRTLATGQEQELKIDIPRFDWLRWCPDSRHLLITSFNWGGPSIVYKVDVQTGDHSDLVQSDKQRIRGAELSADGKTLAYRIRGRGNVNWLIVKDLETSHEKDLLQSRSIEATALSPFSGGWALSPDGKHMALSVREGETDKPLKPLVLKIMSVESGKVRKVAGSSVSELTWTNDGSDLLFVKNGNELWRISAEGGEPRKLWEWKQKIWSPRIHPDGKRIAFFSGGNVSEMWLIENFLPESTAGR